MVAIVEMAELKAKWTEVLDRLELTNRIAWLTFFDARLASLNGNNLKLDFRDPDKFATGHDFGDARAKLLPVLKATIKEVTGEEIEVNW